MIHDANNGKNLRTLNAGRSREDVCIWKPTPDGYPSQVFEKCDETIYCGNYAMRLQCDGNLAFIKANDAFLDRDPNNRQWQQKKLINVSGTRGSNGWGKDGTMFKKDELIMEM